MPVQHGGHLYTQTNEIRKASFTIFALLTARSPKRSAVRRAALAPRASIIAPSQPHQDCLESVHWTPRRVRSLGATPP